jgi:hypothetical protein
VNFWLARVAPKLAAQEIEIASPIGLFDVT